MHLALLQDSTIETCHEMIHIEKTVPTLLHQKPPARHVRLSMKMLLSNALVEIQMVGWSRVLPCILRCIIVSGQCLPPSLMGMCWGGGVCWGERHRWKIQLLMRKLIHMNQRRVSTFIPPDQTLQMKTTPTKRKRWGMSIWCKWVSALHWRFLKTNIRVCFGKLRRNFFKWRCDERCNGW